MKTFDIIGAIVVVGWLVIGGLYVYRAETGESASSEESRVAMDDGETWLHLRREGEDDVGFQYTTFTRLEDGGLAEHETSIAVEVDGHERVVDSELRARLDEDGVVTMFDGSFETADGRIATRGEVDGDRLTIKTSIDGDVRGDSYRLDEPLRLASSAYRELIDRAGDGDKKVRGRFVDPVTALTAEMLFTYEGPTSIDVYETEHRAQRFAREFSGMHHDVYVDDRGNYLIEEFPTRVVGARLPDGLVDSRISAVRRKLDERREEAEERADSSSDISVLDAADAFGASFRADDEHDADDNDRTSE